MEERKCNYERYRGLVQNDFANSEYSQSLSDYVLSRTRSHVTLVGCACSISYMNSVLNVTILVC